MSDIWRGMGMIFRETCIFNFSQYDFVSEFTDNFNRTNNTNLGSDWSEAELHAENLSIDNNQLLDRAIITGGGTARYTTALTGYNSYTKCEVISLDPSGFGTISMFLRQSAPLDYDTPGSLLGGWSYTQGFFIQRTESGNFWEVASAHAAPIIGDEILFIAVGKCYSIWYNSTLVVSATDAYPINITDTYTGLRLDGVTRIDNYETGIVL